MFDRPGQASIVELLEPEFPEARVLLAEIDAAARRENQDAAARLTAIGELYARHLHENSDDRAFWVVDSESSTAAEVSAVLNIGAEAAAIQVRNARALRERLPKVAEVFRAGDLTARIVEALIERTDLITDPAILARVDKRLSVAAPRLHAMSYFGVIGYVDRMLKRIDPDAVRRRKKAAEQREIWINDRLDGLSDVGATVHTSVGVALDKRLDALAATVCAADPRTKAQRRADAIEALTAGADRMTCHCGNPDCPGKDAVAAPFVVHVIAGPAPDTSVGNKGSDSVAHEDASGDSAEGRHTESNGAAEVPLSDSPDTDTDAASATDVSEDVEAPDELGIGSLVGGGGFLDPDQMARLAERATAVRPLVHPGDAAPEPRYTPSRGLADFVRCRDLTCRFPGCSKPATGCDIDHTIPYGRGGPTQASNLKCLCRFHHLIKTFWGWRDEQLRDGTVIWTAPSGEKYVTTPGSAVLFPSLCAPTAPVAPSHPPPVDDRWGEPTAMMPRRTRTRAEQRAVRVAAERRANHAERDAKREARRRAHAAAYFPPHRPPQPGEEPPPF